MGERERARQRWLIEFGRQTHLQRSSCGQDRGSRESRINNNLLIDLIDLLGFESKQKILVVGLLCSFSILIFKYLFNLCCPQHSLFKPTKLFQVLDGSENPMKRCRNNHRANEQRPNDFFSRSFLFSIFDYCTIFRPKFSFPILNKLIISYVEHIFTKHQKTNIKLIHTRIHQIERHFISTVTILRLTLMPLVVQEKLIFDN